MAELVYALVLETSAARLKSSSLFLPTKKNMKVEVQSKKGLRTILSVIIDKKTIQNKMDERLNELQKEVSLKGLEQVKFQLQLLKVSLENLFL